MNNILIECSQKNSNNVEQNGVFETILPVPLTLENGDAFALSKSFLDEEIATDGIINIKNPLNLHIGVHAYIQNDDATKFDATQDENSAEVDNGAYIIYDIIKDTPAAGQPGKMNEITEIEFTWSGLENKDGQSGLFFGDIDGLHQVEFTAKDINGTPFPTYVNIPKTKIKDLLNSTVRVSCSIYCLKSTKTEEPFNQLVNTSLVPNNTNGNWDFNRVHNAAAVSPLQSSGFYFSVTKSSTAPLENIDILTAKTFTKDFLLPAGKYEPDQLVDYINDQINNNTFSAPTIIGLDNIIQSAFLHQSSEFHFGKTTGDQILIPANPVFSALAGGKGGSKGIKNPVISGNPPKQQPFTTNYFIGTNLIELAYSTNFNKFYWNYTHFPIYSTATGNPIITNLVPTFTGNVEPNKQTFIQQGKNGGVFFQELSAEDISGGGFVPFDFWNGVLGFTSNIIPQPSLKTFRPAGNEYTGNIYTLIDGVHTTNAGDLIDAMVNKASYQKFAPNAPFSATNSFNNVIYAQNVTIGDGVLDTPYYLIEIQLNFSSNIVGEGSITKNISGIVNRYYSKGSYVSGAGDPSFVINYKGESIIIQSMKIRILNPNRSVASVGEDNTLFFEIVKQMETQI